MSAESITLTNHSPSAASKLRRDKRIQRRISLVQRRVERLLERQAGILEHVQATDEHICGRDSRESWRLYRSLCSFVNALHESDYKQCTHLLNVLHKVKSPLMVVGSAARQLRNHEWSEHERNQWLDAIIRNVTVMETIIVALSNDMRESSISTRSEIQSETVDVLALVREVVHEYGDATRTHTIKFRGDSTSHSTVQGDAGALKKLFWNLLNNVVRSSDAIHEICISVWTNSEEATVLAMVEDCGWSVTRRERRFLPFVPLEKARDMLGEPDLGLALVKIIADSHGATVRMQGGRGAGSAFAVKFVTSKE